MTSTTSLQIEQPQYKCQQCKDTGYIIKSWEGGGLASECPCQEQERLNKRFASAMIPDEFQTATFQAYKVGNPAQKQLFDASVAYVKEFGQEIEIDFGVHKGNSLGFIAVFGESRLKALPTAERMKVKRQHNNYGLGKTHLQMAIARELIRRGHTVLCVSDVALMDELMATKMENTETYNHLLRKLIDTPILVWDDIGKSNPSEAKRAAYFHVINERYKAKRPIIYSSNEDVESLSDRIGDAAASRLLGMSKGRIVRVEGPDYRLTGGKQHERTATA
jgi:DNA replication protein DnaC